MAALLRAAVHPGTTSRYARRLLAAVDATQDAGATQEGVLDPLSARELDVLRLLGTDLSGSDIARALFVSLNTVRTHTRNIYAKLGVNTRRAAVRRAEELHLTSRPRNR
jgi:LuxR family transcriptional regulator, maltose regulon positive regulatory protein